LVAGLSDENLGSNAQRSSVYHGIHIILISGGGNEQLSID